MRRFVCSLCGRDYEFEGQELHLCPVCGGSIEPVYDLEGQREHYRDVLTRKKAPREGIWGYRDLLPVEPGLEPVSLAEGNTPLQDAENLAGELGIRRLYLKNETRNPSHAYKDRFSTIAISMA
ncbi:MAG: threonine synthase, partial [Firmicutes bacterium]|nr:threonine synthase [Bacillota bacterium]